MSKICFLFFVITFINITHCSLYGEQLRQYFHNIYAPTTEERTISRRNNPTVIGSGIYQEPSSRDLDVGFAIGVKDEGEASDILINNHSSITYASPVSELSNSASYLVQEPSASKELNIGVFIDPKNGVKYYTPGFVPSNGRPNIQEFLPGRYGPTSVVPAVGQIYPLIDPNQQYPILNSHQQTFSSYPLTPKTSNFVSRFSQTSPNINTIPYPYQINPSIGPLPPNVFSGPIPEQNYFNKLSNAYLNQQEGYPFQNYFQQPPETSTFSGVSYTPKNFLFFPSQIPETIYRLPMIENAYDESVYPGRFARSHERLPYQNSYIRYKIPFRNFQIQEEVPREPLAQPVTVRQETQAPEIIVDQQGIPVMSAQPYGERQVGAFKLRSDHGYQVTMNVPPVPGDGPADGVLVMEMKANLYRPLS